MPNARRDEPRLDLNIHDARILIIDDQEANVLFLENLLQEGGYSCWRSLTDSRDCAAVCHDFKPDLVLLDWLMPGLDGLGVLEALRPHLEAEVYLPVLVLTVDISAEAKRRALVAGARDFLAKPLDAIEALLRVKNLLETRLLYQRLRKRADERIREQAALIDEANDAIMVCDLDDRITFWSRGTELAYGLPRDEAVGRNVSELRSTSPEPTDPDTTDIVDPPTTESLIETGSWTGELAQKTRDGRELVVASRWTLLRDGEGKPKSKLVINTDISEKKKTEAKLLRAQRLENIGRLAGGIAHDLNNILTPLTMGVDLLGLSCTSDSDRTLLATLQATLQRGSDLVKQILSFSRGLDAPRHDMNLAPLIKELAALFRQTFPRSITIETEIARDLSPVNADPTQLHQVLTNLCVNARDAMPDGGQLRIAAGDRTLGDREVAELPAGPYVVVTVEDTGTGIPADVLPRIFEPFYTTKEAGKGTGLGLSTSQGIVKNHGGAIVVESEPGRGTRFRFFLPARDASKTKPAEPMRREPPIGRGELILAVDDEAAFLNIAKLTLTSGGYRVLTARNGVEALAMHGPRIAEVDVLLTDQMMPVMDGAATVKAFRKQNSRAKVIVCSGLTTGQESAELASAAFLAKPYTVDALLTKVRSVLDS